MDVSRFVGMSLTEATAAAKLAGFEVAIEVASGPQRLNCEYRQGRITFQVTDGTVTSAYVG